MYNILYNHSQKHCRAPIVERVLCRITYTCTVYIPSPHLYKCCYCLLPSSPPLPSPPPLLPPPLPSPLTPPLPPSLQAPPPLSTTNPADTWVIQYQETGIVPLVDRNTSDNSTTFVLDGLTSFTVYTARVAGINSCGVGIFSEFFSATTLAGRELYIILVSTYFVCFSMCRMRILVQF